MSGEPTPDAPPLVYGQMAKVLRDLSHIPKQRSQGVSYEFRGIDSVLNALHGPFAEHGLFLAPRVLDDWQLNMIPGTNSRVQSQALFRVEVTVYATDGSSVTLGPGLAQSHDYGDKAVYQAQQNAIKYLLLEAFCIPTAEQDMDGREPDAVPAQTADQATAKPIKLGDLRDLNAMLDALPDGKQRADKILEWAGVQVLGRLSRMQADTAMHRTAKAYAEHLEMQATAEAAEAGS
jgi:hypothetical protein